MNINLELSILFLLMTEIGFGLSFGDAHYVVSVCFGYYLDKRRPPQIYVEVKDCIFRLKNGCNSKPNAKVRNFKGFF